MEKDKTFRIFIEEKSEEEIKATETRLRELQRPQRQRRMAILVAALTLLLVLAFLLATLRP